MNFIDKKNCFEQFFLIFLLIFISIPLQVHYESFDLFYFFGIINYFKLLILVFLFSILFYLIFFKLHKKINFLLKLILVALIFLGIFFPVSGHIDIYLKNKISINLYLLNCIKLILIFFITKFFDKNFKNYTYLKHFIWMYTLLIMLLLAITLKTNYETKKFENLFKFSNQENLLVLSFDGISSDIFFNELNFNQTNREFLKDFTFYKNAHSNSTGTWISTNLEIYGKEIFKSDSMNQREYLEVIRKNAEKIDKNSNFVLDTYGQYIRNFGKGANKYINYSLDQSKKINNLFYHIKQIFIQSTARYLSSYGAKMVSSFFFNKSFKKLYEKENLYSLNFDTYFDYLRISKNIIVDYESKKNFIKFLHFDFTHSPINFDRNCNYKFYDKDWKLNKPNFKDIEITKCLIKLIFPIIDNLKKKKIYDKTTIIIKSDHGRRKEFYEKYPNNVKINKNKYFSYGRFRSLLLIKNINQKNINIEFIDDEVFLSDLNYIYCKKKVVKCSNLNSYDFDKNNFIEKQPVQIFIPKDSNSYVNYNENYMINFDRNNNFYKVLENL